jgi:electron transfer flavoprotein alpha/beta subunit
VPATDATAVSAADDAVDVLLDAGRSPADILVLTVGDAHPWEQHELSFGADAYWRQQDEGDDVFYATATAERAVKRPVVVLAVNGGSAEDSANALPAALARTGELLVVCGDPERLRTLL